MSERKERKFSANSQEELEQVLRELEFNYLPWYASRSEENASKYNRYKRTAIGLSFLVSLLVAVDQAIPDLFGPKSAAWTILLIALPLMSTAAVGLQERFLAAKALRERGRIAVQEMIFEGHRQRVAALENSSLGQAGSFSKVLEDIETKLAALEKEQLDAFVTGESGPTTGGGR